MTTDVLGNLVASRQQGQPRGIPSVCSAHPLVIEATLRQGLVESGPVLIEATCNQVNHQGGYTGMTPAAFRSFVDDIASAVGFPADRLILGGDHLGPNPWKGQPPEEAMAEAEQMIRDYVRAGFRKIHLDTSMGCLGEPVALGDEMTAARAARLASAAEAAALEAGTPLPVYVIGTEVPIPGGAMEVIDTIEVTHAEAAIETYEAHRAAFAAAGLNHAFTRVVAVVVQPGVEFGNENVVVYDPAAATLLSGALDSMDGIIFEAHSTDYQPNDALSSLVRDGFAILKVGPGVTFALREALYGLDQIRAFLDGVPPADGLFAEMERLMVAEPANWERYYHGTEAGLRQHRHFSYSDRIRYYWTHPRAEEAVRRLFEDLGNRTIPETLISQYLGGLYAGVASGRIRPVARELAVAAVQQVVADYFDAAAPAPNG